MTVETDRHRERFRGTIITKPTSAKHKAFNYQDVDNMSKNGIQGGPSSHWLICQTVEIFLKKKKKDPMLKSDFMLSKSQAAQANHKRVCLDVDHQVNKADSYPPKKKKQAKLMSPSAQQS